MGETMRDGRFITPRGYNMYDMSSMMQKSIRRGDVDRASFAAYELYGKFYKYVWKRLIVVSAEDCYGIMTKEIVGLKAADDIVNEGRKAGERDPLFLAKAVMLLCMARKNRDACYTACNFMHPERILDPSEIDVDYDIAQLQVDEIPDWVYDCHTIRGKMGGKTDFDMTVTEQEALTPLQMSIFDNGDWAEYYDHAYRNGDAKRDEYQATKEWGKSKKTSEQCIRDYFGDDAVDGRR